MKKINHTLVALSMLVSAAQATTDPKEEAFPSDLGQITDAETHTGSTKIEDKKYTNLRIFGPATLSNVTLSGILGIAGPLTIKSSNITKLLAMGTVKLEKVTLSTAKVTGVFNSEESTVTDTLLVTGAFNAEDSTFKGPIEITTAKMNFDHCTAASIHVLKNAASVTEPQKIFLSKTIVTGDITFDAGNGVIYAKKGTVIKGKVNGGKVVEK
jgi:hypothetical protein